MRMIWNVVSDDIAPVSEFYRKVLGFEPAFESDWYIQLARDGFEIGVLKRGREIDPTGDVNPGSTYPTFVVDDLAPVLEAAENAIVSSPSDTFYGQRRAILRDPDGRLMDVSMLIPA
ncbi:MAG: VOC family protein [Pseudomonadota bacterium]